MARPEYFINPTGTVAKRIWNAGEAAVSTSKQYASKVGSRYRDANVHIAPKSEIEKYVTTRYYPMSRNKGYYGTTDMPPIREGEFVKLTGGVRLKPSQTMEIHLNPDYYYSRGPVKWEYHHS